MFWKVLFGHLFTVQNNVSTVLVSLFLVSENNILVSFKNKQNMHA